MKIDSAKIEALRELLAAPHRKIVLVAHTNPDGDAIGASTAWRDVLAAMGHEVTMIVPNKYPYFLDWMPDIREVVIFRFAPERALEAIRGADIVFCLDFNSLSRLEALSDALAENTAARRVLIDHHLSPDGGFDLQFSYPQSSSTCWKFSQGVSGAKSGLYSGGIPGESAKPMAAVPPLTRASTMAWSIMA